MPERFALVGERPAGAVRGDDLEMAVLSLAAGDLGWRVRRGVAVAARDGVGVEEESGLGEAVLRIKLEGLKMTSLTEPVEHLAALERFAENRGSTFSASSVSMSSALRLPAAAGDG